MHTSVPRNNTLSVIIPAFNEHERIDVTLRQVRAVLGGDAEIIVADQSADDATYTIVRSHHSDVVYVRSTGTCRAATMNQWAHVATGDMLVFLHADTTLPVSAKKLLETVDRDRFVGGWFYQRQTPTTPFLRLLNHMVNRYMERKKYLLGDNCIFIDREVFVAVGGYREKPLFEDVDMAMKMRKYAALHHKKLLVIKDPVSTSSRKYLDDNGLKRSGLRTVVRCQLLFFLGYPVEKIEKIYYKKRK